VGVAKPLKKLKKLKKEQSKNKKLDLDKMIKQGNQNITLEFLHTPVKSPACKKCPALAEGICKCARKRLK